MRSYDNVKSSQDCDVTKFSCKASKTIVKCVITQFNDDVITVLVLAALHF